MAEAAPTHAHGLDAALIAAIGSGRDLIVADRHRATALRLAWARHQQGLGRTVWATPSIHTWDAWLARQWRDAVLRGAAPPLQLLAPSQERLLWESVLARRAGEGGDAAALTLHAGALLRTAARATQAQLVLEQSAQSEEELLLVNTLKEVRSVCAADGLLSLRLAPAESLAFLASVAPPLIVGEPSLTALQAALARRFWPDTQLLLVPAQAASVEPVLLRANDLEQELAACAEWCRTHLQRDTGARLLVVTACAEPSPAIQAALLWRTLAPGRTGDDAARERWLAVEGGEPLLHQALFADALIALGLMDSPEGIETTDLLTLLRSPYLEFGSTAETVALATWIADTGLACFGAAALRDALRQAATHHPAAHRLAACLETLRAVPATAGRQGTTQWATRFSEALAAAGFAPTRLASREQQRLARWHELLDEFASLDSVLAPMPAGEALRRLRQLAGQARHQAASGDAAITFTDSLADPIAGYDGIWVLGLADSRWPDPPRPDAWVALGEQRRAGWSEAGVAQRREQAQWALDSWRQRGRSLVLSYPAREGDLAHRPTTMIAAGSAWTSVAAGTAFDAVIGLAANDTDLQVAPLTAAQLTAPLAGGAARLATQQDCPFRALAHWRLGAEPPASLCDGVPAALRGRLLHALLNFLWLELKDQPALLALDAPAQQHLLARSWTAAVRVTREASWLAPQVRERERERALEVTARLLELERQRTPFTVEQRERSVAWQGAGAQLGLRIDRVDRVGSDTVLLDYKSGTPARVELHDGALRPLQLALYATALAQQGEPVSAVALVGLNAAAATYAGVTAHGGLLPPDLHEVPDWQPMQLQWQQELQRLMADHLSGAALLTRDRKVCARCHLPALCRRAGAEAVEPEDG